MDSILAMIEGPSGAQITTFDQNDHKLFEEFLGKSSVWDFYDMTKEEYLKKDDQQTVFNY